MRHGQTDWNAQGRIQGHTDIPLNDHGHQQARDAVDRIRGLPITRIISSDLSRALDTARPAAQALGLPVTTDARLRERCFGVFEGCTWPQIELEQPELYARYQADRACLIPEAETLDALHARVTGAVLDIVRAGGGTPLVVTHGGVVRSLMHAVPGGGLPGPIINAGTYVFELDEALRFTRVMLV